MIVTRITKKFVRVFILLPYFSGKYMPEKSTAKLFMQKCYVSLSINRQTFYKLHSLYDADKKA